MTVSGPDRSKRAFLRGRRAPAPLRPPWTSEAALAEACTRCGDCISACPEGVLARGEGGFPAFDPRLGSGTCSFCGACAEACGEGLFQATSEKPWSIAVELLSGACLAEAGIHCESCRDACLEQAIRFRPRLGGPPRPEILAQACTGCGACVGSCPADALLLHAQQQEGEAA
ncbi:ferredoxin-type protein NapF [Limibacillus halophilus]